MQIDSASDHATDCVAESPAPSLPRSGAFSFPLPSCIYSQSTITQGDSMTEKKVKNGRPPKYKPEFDDIAKRLCEAGATDEEIAEMLKIGRTTFYRWRNEHPTFRYALKIGKASADDRVEQSLYQKALGAHVVEEEQAFRLKDKDGNERVEIVKVRKGMPADTTAAIFWLKNRRRREWQDAQVVQHELPLASEVAEAMGKIDDDL